MGSHGPFAPPGYAYVHNPSGLRPLVETTGVIYTRISLFFNRPGNNSLLQSTPLVGCSDSYTAQIVDFFTSMDIG